MHMDGWCWWLGSSLGSTQLKMGEYATYACHTFWPVPAPSMTSMLTLMLIARKWVAFTRIHQNIDFEKNTQSNRIFTVLSLLVELHFGKIFFKTTQIFSRNLLCILFLQKSRRVNLGNFSMLLTTVNFCEISTHYATNKTNVSPISMDTFIIKFSILVEKRHFL